MLQMHDGVSIKKTITPHTVPFFLCRAFHPCMAENGVFKLHVHALSYAQVCINNISVQCSWGTGKLLNAVKVSTGQTWSHRHLSAMSISPHGARDQKAIDL